jgi:hypothetical protein
MYCNHAAHEREGAPIVPNNPGRARHVTDRGSVAQVGTRFKLLVTRDPLVPRPLAEQASSVTGTLVAMAPALLPVLVPVLPELTLMM